MSVKIYLNGTDGNTDGTLETPGDGVGVILGNVGSVAVFHFRADPGEQNSTSFIVNAGEDYSVSSDGENFGVSASYSSGEISGVNVPCYIRREGGTIGDPERVVGLTTTPRLGVITTEAAPAPPIDFTPTVTDITTDSVVVSFSTTDPNGDDITYKVAVTTSATPPSDWSGYADVTSPHTVSDLTPQTDYYAHVRASDGEFYTYGVSDVFQTLELDVTSPVLSGILVANAVSSTQISISGVVASDSSGIKKWQYRADSGTWVDIPSSNSPSMPTHTVGGFSPNTEHSFEVRAFDMYDNISDPSNTATATTQGAAFTGTYYPTGYDRSGDFEGDKQLVTPKPNEATGVDTVVAEGEFYYEGRLDLAYALYKLNASGGVVATIKDWTAVGYIDNAEGGYENQVVQTVTGQSFADPNIGADEFFALRFRGVMSGTGTGTAYTPYFTLAKGVNPGAQSNVTVAVTGSIDEEDSTIVCGIANLPALGFPALSYIVFGV